MSHILPLPQMFYSGFVHIFRVLITYSSTEWEGVKNEDDEMVERVGCGHRSSPQRILIDCLLLFRVRTKRHPDVLSRRSLVDDKMSRGLLTQTFRSHFPLGELSVLKFVM